MEWNISLIGVLIACVFATLAGAAIGVMYGLSVRQIGQRRHARILARMRGAN